jgi:hypothetical protein
MHLSKGELACRRCLDAHREDNKKYRKPSTRDLQPCGTYGGYRRHQREQTEICHPCHEARLTYGRNRREQFRRKTA